MLASPLLIKMAAYIFIPTKTSPQHHHKMATDNIDTLLQRYLVLLDEYSTLRAELSHLQKLVFQDLARANFSAERGLRYGQDQYDERMQATRRVAISGEKTPSFQISTYEEPEESVADEVETEEGAEKKKPTKRSRDPLRWFGVLTPQALRNAQASSVKAVQDIIPRLVSVNSEMVEVEIEVRRARKKRAKAEKEQGVSEGITA